MFFVFFIVKKLFLELLVKNLTFIFWCDIIKFSPKVEI